MKFNFLTKKKKNEEVNKLIKDIELLKQEISNLKNRLNKECESNAIVRRYLMNFSTALLNYFNLEIERYYEDDPCYGPPEPKPQIELFKFVKKKKC